MFKLWIFIISFPPSGFLPLLDRTVRESGEKAKCERKRGKGAGFELCSPEAVPMRLLAPTNRFSFVGTFKREKKRYRTGNSISSDPMLLILCCFSTVGYYSKCVGGFGAEVRDQRYSRSGAWVEQWWGVERPAATGFPPDKHSGRPSINYFYAVCRSAALPTPWWNA